MKYNCVGLRSGQNYIKGEYKGVPKIFPTDAVKIINLTTKRV
jgi:hypothetical protein